MPLFSQQFKRLDEFVISRPAKTCGAGEIRSWPDGGQSNVVLMADTAVELGNPQDESVSFLLWDDDGTSVHDEAITIIGPDIDTGDADRLPFGKIVKVVTEKCDDSLIYDRYREMESLRYDLSLKGYMMRAVSQYGREWSRVSRDAVAEGFTLPVLGKALIDKFKELSYVQAAEVLFVTSSREDVASLRPLCVETMKIIEAMNKMINEMSFDCDTCDYLPVCSEVEDLRSMKREMERKEIQ